MNTNTALRNSIIGLLFATLFVPLVVSGSLYFPYITGKAFLFRILIEVAFALYLILVLRDRSYLPRRSVIVWSFSAFLVIMALATIVSENPLKSFWSNYERMEGYVTLLVLAAYFVMLAGTFSRRVWFWFFHASLFMSLIVGIFGLAETFHGVARIAGTLGNSTYLGVYALLHAFLALFLAVRAIERKEKGDAIWWVVGYAIFGIYNAYIMYHTGTRGSFIGMAVGGVLATIIIAIFERNRPLLRKTAVGVCVVIVIMLGVLGISRDSSYVKSSVLLSRFSSLLTFDFQTVLKEQGYSRTLLWSIAGKGLQERPLLGWGQESFNYVFAKYYDPRMYNQEQWFDRSHDVFFDWLVAGGILGLAGYLSLFVAILYLLWKKNQQPIEEEWTLPEKAVLTGLLVAYFIHNIFVFDNLVSYLFFFMLLAYIHRRSTETREAIDHAPLIGNYSNQVAGYVVIVILIGGALYYSFLKPYLQGTYLINALQAHAGQFTSVKGKSVGPSEKDVVALELFKKAFAENTFGNSETLERLTDVTGDVVTSKDSDPKVAQDYTTYLAQRYAVQFKESPKDPRYKLFEGLYLLRIGHLDESIVVLKEALVLAPGKQSLMTQLSIAYFTQKDVAKALDLIKSAYEEEKTNKEALSVYATMLIYSSQAAKADEVIADGLLHQNDVSADSRVLQALIDTKDFPRLIAAAEKRLASDPKNPQVHISAAAIFLKAGNRTRAIKELETAALLAPEFKAQADKYIEVIKKGGDPTAGSAPQAAAQQ